VSEQFDRLDFVLAVEAGDLFSKDLVFFRRLPRQSGASSEPTFGCGHKKRVLLWSNTL
jgi:hypothetical protein